MKEDCCFGSFVNFRIIDSSVGVKYLQREYQQCSVSKKMKMYASSGSIKQTIITKKEIEKNSRTVGETKSKQSMVE